MDQPWLSCSEPKDLLLLVVDKPTAEEPDPSCLESAPSALIVIEEPATKRSGPSCREPKSLAIVVLDELAAERPVPSCDLKAGFGKRLQKRLYETTELSCSSIQGGQPKGVQREPEMEVVSEPVPHSYVDRSGGVLSTEEEANPALGGSPATVTRQRGILPMKLSLSPLVLPVVLRWRRC